MEPGREYLAKKLGEIRRFHNEKVDEVGKAVSKSGKTISAWEVGRGQPDADSLMKLCEHFGVPVMYFYDDSDIRPRMRSLEDAIKALIKENYGSVPKFAAKIGVAATSVYSALDRGMANTRTELTDKIYRELNIDWDSAKLSGFEELRVKGNETVLTKEEDQLVRDFRALDANRKRMALSFVHDQRIASEYASSSNNLTTDNKEE